MNLENILNMLERQENKEGITNNFMHLFLLFHVTFRNLKSHMCPAYICGPVLACNILHTIKQSISVSKFLWNNIHFTQPPFILYWSFLSILMANFSSEVGITGLCPHFKQIPDFVLASNSSHMWQGWGTSWCPPLSKSWDHRLLLSHLTLQTPLSQYSSQRGPGYQSSGRGERHTHGSAHWRDCVGCLRKLQTHKFS